LNDKLNKDNILNASKYKKFNFKKLSKNNKIELSNEDFDFLLKKEDYKVEDKKEIKINNNPKIITSEEKQNLNNSLLIINKDNNFKTKIYKNPPNKIFLTNIKEFTETKIIPGFNLNNNLNLNKYPNMMNNNNSVLNNSASQNINTLINESFNNIQLNKETKSSRPNSQSKLPYKNYQTSSPSKGEISKPISPTNKIIINSKQFRNLNPLKQDKINQVNNLNLENDENNKSNNMIETNNCHYDIQNTSLSSCTSVFNNKSMRVFQSNNNLTYRRNSLNKIENNLFPTRILSSNNVNHNAFEKNKFKSGLMSNCKSDINSFNNLSIINQLRSYSMNINQIKKTKPKKISNKEREFLIKIKQLNEEISKINPINEDNLENIPKKGDFKRGGKFKKLKSEYLITKFYQDKNYDNITSNFKKESIDKINNFYADNLNLNININMKSNSNHNLWRENFIIESNKNPIFYNENLSIKENNPIGKFFYKLPFYFYSNW